MNLGPIDIRPDPGLSNQRPGWLADNETWRNHLDAMTGDDTAWTERHWELAGGAKPDLDMMWVTTETIGGTTWAWPVVLAFWALVIGLPIAVAVQYLAAR
jgi:hypothetical protein